jgi:hypothetical protein
MPLLTVECGIDRIARITERPDELPVEILIIFDDEYSHGCRFLGLQVAEPVFCNSGHRLDYREEYGVS